MGVFRFLIRPIYPRGERPDTHWIGRRDSLVGISTGYGLGDLGSMVSFPAGAGNFSLHHRVQNGSGDHPASYPMGSRGPFLGRKAAGEWSWLLTSI